MSTNHLKNSVLYDSKSQNTASYDFRYSQDGDTKRGDVGLIKVKKQVDF